jgi:hypothetical protein
MEAESPQHFFCLSSNCIVTLSLSKGFDKLSLTNKKMRGLGADSLTPQLCGGGAP